MTYIVEAPLAILLGSAEKAMIVDMLNRTLASPHNFYVDTKFDGIHYADDTAQTWLRRFKWMTLEEVQKTLDELIDSPYIISFRTPSGKLYYRPDVAAIKKDWRY